MYRGAAGFERLVVVKRVHRKLTSDREFSAMLLDEARLASSIRHPNVVPVIDIVRSEDEVVLVMEYVESVSLAQLLRAVASAGATLSIPVVARIVVDVLTGLHEAHEAVDVRRQPLGIVHRDVSPENVVVGVDGISRVVDFGIAKARSRLARTRAGVVKGKCAYMAPEQVDGQPVDRRCDVFAAGIVLWEALTGKRLFRGDDEFDEMRRVMREAIAPPSSLSPGCSAALDAVLAAALARPPDERFQTAKAFARALEQAIVLAPAAEVAAQVEAFCGAALTARNDQLVALLGPEVEKLGARMTRSVPPTRPDLRAPAPPSTRGGTVKMPTAPHAGPDAGRDPGRSTPGASAYKTLASRVSPGEPPSERILDVTSLAPPPRPPKRRSIWPMLAVVLVASVLVGAGAALVWLAHGR